MSKHTPGPWFAGYRRAGSILSVKDSDGSVIAEICQWKTSTDWSVKDEPPMNANLIAAAPDLLEALAGLFEIGDVFGSAIEHKDPHCQSFDSWAETAKAAIAKARGES